MKKLQIVSILCVLGCMFSIIGCTPKKPSPSGSGTTSVSSANNDVVRSDGTIDPAGKTDLKGKEILVFGNLIPKKEDANYEEMKEYFDSVCEKLGCTVKCSEPDSWETFIDTFRTQVMAGDFAGDIVAYGILMGAVIGALIGTLCCHRCFLFSLRCFCSPLYGIGTIIRCPV